MTQPFQPRQAVLLAALAAVYPAIALGAGAARIDFATGGVAAQAPDGSRRVLSRGSEVVPGETVLTNDGRAQMRFTDGAMVSLKPGSEFRIDDYRFSGKSDGDERGFFSLLKGGLRTITGLVGRADRSKYRINTAVATIGIRGTEFSVTYGNSINVNTGDGIVEVCNSSGCLVLYPGDEGYVQQDTTPPVLVQTGEERPKKDDSPPGLSSIEAPANDRDANGQIVLGNLLTGTQNYGIVFGHSGFGGGSGVVDGGLGTINSAGALTSFEDSGSSAYDPNTSGGTVSSLGNDGIVAWGRWMGGAGGLTIASSTSGEGGEFLHYVAGLPTLASDPTVGTSATFSLLGGSVSGTSSGLGSITSASLNVTFGSQVNSLSIGATVGGNSYVISGGTASLPLTGNLVFSMVGVPVSVGVCTGCPTANVQGALYGSGASRAGISFDFFDNFASFQTIAGAVALKRN